MNAIEFVNKYGVNEAKRYSKMIGLSVVEGVSVEDLKQIVDAFELVGRFGGLFSAKVSLNKEGYTGGIECGDDLIDDDQLKMAINLMEQCNA